MAENMGKGPSGHGQLTKIRLSDGCGGKAITTAAQFEYDCHGFEGYLGNVGLELTRLIERLHRRFLDVLRAELNRMSIKDINAVQALLLANIGEEEIVIRDLVERGYYQGSNVSYNIKKLVDMGYLDLTCFTAQA